MFSGEYAVMAGNDAMSTIKLNKPGAGETVQVAMQRGHVYSLDFDIGVTTFVESGKDIVLRFDDGAGMVLQNFISTAKSGDFYLKLPDGALLLGKDVVDAVTRTLDDFHPSNDGYALWDEAHDANQSGAPAHSEHRDFVHGSADHQIFSPVSADTHGAGPICGAHCELPFKHGSQGSPFSMEALHELPVSESSLLSGAGYASDAHSYARSSAAGGADPTAALHGVFSPHGGGEALHFGDLLDSRMPASSDRDAHPGDLDSLLSPQAPPHQTPQSDSGHAPEAPHSPEALHSLADNLSLPHSSIHSPTSVDCGDASQDQALLARLLLLSSL